jgi:peptide-methionine (S)-S-oxide reductase
MNQQSWVRISGVVGVAAVFMVIGLMASGRPELSTASAAPPETPAANTNESKETVTESSESKTAVATLAGGCFWCTEAVFERMEGVQDVVSGYLGGQIPNPTYQAVCTGLTGHAEAVAITYDPSKTSFEKLLEVFFATHDPTTLNQQGADKGTQYRSAIFYHNDEQKEIAEAYIKQLNETREFRRRPIVTTLEPHSTFYVAEEYHQDYFRRNPAAGYCQAVVRPKVMKFQKEFKDQVKKN